MGLRGLQTFPLSCWHGVNSVILQYHCPIGYFAVGALAISLLVTDCQHRRRNHFSVGGAKIGENQSEQSRPKYNFMQNVFFKKGVYCVQWGLWQSPQKLGSFGEFLC